MKSIEAGMSFQASRVWKRPMGLKLGERGSNVKPGTSARTRGSTAAAKQVGWFVVTRKSTHRGELWDVSGSISGFRIWLGDLGEG